MDSDGYFTVSPKTFDIIRYNLRIGNCRTMSYAAMRLKFIERKESLVYIWIFRIFGISCYNF
jgi:ABC-type maltose transport system permease subunit